MAKKAKKKVKAAKKPAAKNKVKKAASKKAALKKTAARKPKLAAVKKNGASALPRPSNRPHGEAGRALDGVRILDFTHVQSGPTCTQLLAYLGADVIKIERPGVGDITRGQLRDVPNADSLYFTMLNGSKRSITIDSKHPKGKEILARLIKACDVLVENFAPGALDRMGLDLGLHQQDQPAHDRRFGQGLRAGSLRRLQGLRERRAMRRRRCLDHRLPRRPAAGDRRTDRRFRHRSAPGVRHRRRTLSAQPHRPRPARARRHAGRRAQPVPRQAARSTAPKSRPAQ